MADARPVARSRRLTVVLAACTLVLAACGGPAAGPSSSAQAAGILQVNPGEQVQARPLSEIVAQALSDAMVMARANGDDLGYPWIDPGTGELVLSAVTAHGRVLIAGAGISVPHRIREVAHGAAELVRIGDDVTFLHSRGVPDSELIYETIPDHRDNRALIVISAASPSLLAYLAAHYPADAIAIEVDPTGAGGAPAAAP